jgi:hypothetical protein
VSLAPGEQRALARIENALRRSDPRLAAMLAAFTVPVTVRLAVCLARAFRHGPTRRIALALVLPAVSVIAMSWLLISQPAQASCPPGMQSSSHPQAGGFCGRTGSSAFGPASRTAGSTRRPGARMTAARAGWRLYRAPTP